MLDPFNGLGSVPYVALQEGRQAIGIELNPDYFQISVNYLTEQETILSGTVSLFGGMSQFEARDSGDGDDDDRQTSSLNLLWQWQRTSHNSRQQRRSARVKVQWRIGHFWVSNCANGASSDTAMADEQISSLR